MTKRDGSKPSKSRKTGQKSLEDLYRTLFAVPIHSRFPVRGRLTVYRTVPSVTTYGVYEKPI